MRVLVQLVKEARVDVAGKTIGRCGRGFLLFVGFARGDSGATCEKMADKIAKLRVFPDEGGKTNKSLRDIGGSILSVSQFTLYADCGEGNRPSFAKAMPGVEGKPLYALFNNMLKERGFAVETGLFGADMQVSLVNDGPFTIWLDSEDLFK
ncbi:MAG: D-aminoacyl-tRNA deacylase [Bacilli bacterium]|jgi:D-tyrosyl-tRNA(Tyr) deacylase|nr:D-aminoacyl-tRNA deacylase [Bacilli bacterium]